MISLRIRKAAAFVAMLFLWGASEAFAQDKKPQREFELRAESPAFWKLVSRDAKLETVASGFGFTEGPVWDRSGFLYVSDEEINKIFRVYPDGHKEELIALGDPDGKYTVLADRFEGNRFNSPNDVVVGPDGAIYFTDPTLDLPRGEKQEIPFQGVYRLDERGEVRLLTKELTQPNGLAFSPDSKRLYVDDSKQRNIRVYDFSPDGTLKNGRIFGDEPGDRGDGVPDGMKLDRDGNLFVTGPKGIWVWDKQGHHTGTIVLPTQPANLTWGDKDYRTLYITAATSVYKLRMKARGFVPYLAHTQ